MKEEIKHAFLNVRANEELIEQTREALMTKKRRTLKKPIFVLCTLAFLGIFYISHQIYFTATSRVSLDVNPSIEVAINRFDKVIDVKAYNEDGETYISSMNLLYKDYKEVLSNVIEASWMQEYLINDEELVVTVAKNDQNQGQEIYDYIVLCTSKHENISCHTSSWKESDEASKLGLSCGRYDYYINLSIYDPSLTPQDINQMSMKEIRDLLASYQNEIPSTNQQNGHHYHGGNHD